MPLGRTAEIASLVEHRSRFTPRGVLIGPDDATALSFKVTRICNGRLAECHGRDKDCEIRRRAKEI